MIDSISISKQLTQEELNIILSNLKVKEELVNANTGEVRVNAKVDEVISIYIRGIHMQLWGSLSQFYIGSRVTSLRWGQVSKAFERLEEKLGVELGTSYFTRLDLEATMSLPHKTKSYFPYLGEHKHYNRFQDRTTLYYSNSSRQICIYDKGLALDPIDRSFIPEHQSLMRFEARYKWRFLKRLAKNRGVEKISVTNILDPTFQETLIGLWLAEYNSIPKYHKLQFNMEKVGSVKELKQALEAHAIDSLGGVHEVISMIERARATNIQLDRKIASKMKSTIRAYTQQTDIAISSPHIAELTIAISIAYIENLLSINESY